MVIRRSLKTAYVGSIPTPPANENHLYIRAIFRIGLVELELNTD